MANIDASTPQLKAFVDWSKTYVSLDVKNVEPLLSKNFTFKSFPKTPDLAELTKEEHLQVLGRVFASMTKFEPIVHEVIEAPGKVVLHGTGLLTTVHGTTIDYGVVFILSLVEEDGELKIVECKEFVDPEKRSALIALAGAPRAS